MDSPPNSPVVLGRLAGAYGVRGWLRVSSYTDPPEGILDYDPVALSRRNDRWSQARFDAGHCHGDGLVAHLVGCDDRDRAAALSGASVAIDAAQLPSLPAGEYYWNELVGLAVWSVASEPPTRLGTVARLLETGANDVLFVAPDADSLDGRERLIPYLRDRVVREVNLERGVVRVDWEADF